MNVLLFEERHLCARCGGDAGRCSPPRAFSSQQLLSASFANQQPNSSSVSPQSTSPAPFCHESASFASTSSVSLDDRRRLHRGSNGANSSTRSDDNN
ncbi:unnamed protein product, partial [Anisakis simplex]|uniref:Uncharacterized protein n=1 Tax=Anisakis simplex TaxID=6269 RepID=A0A0M3JHX4_ANISI